ncbi:pyridoxal phosphate phosphatase PHOSPHO2-like [Venturia canescens]|uniref:pyridoxal phosphate phosphatase PHOSPHO2-like n=1 Tax=Venturia canescens TaxID=32260 RepID=UPI001C9BD01D|nr:pyridoxal phosphate phosphatase PHOSPHO2-like [Venturia canescens]XP_043272967.1 pyridoxal phosphate phosphatase PHOSPHO2-like [Venturia canescens]
MTKPLLVAFDFDHTVVNGNTDTVIRNLLKDEEALTNLEKTYHNECWTVYMRQIFECLHKSGVTKKDIENAISTIQPVDGFPSLMEKLHSQNVEIIIISDSNTFFIKHWLEHQKLNQTVKEVFSNPASFDDTGLLMIDMYHMQDWCKLSEINMCKGHILEDYIKRRSEEGIEFQKIAYVGDGRNDLCPILRLSAEDLAFTRNNYSLAKILKEIEGNVDRTPKAEIIEWKDGTEIWEGLVRRMPNLDCKNNLKSS